MAQVLDLPSHIQASSNPGETIGKALQALAQRRIERIQEQDQQNRILSTLLKAGFPLHDAHYLSLFMKDPKSLLAASEGMHRSQTQELGTPKSQQQQPGTFSLQRKRQQQQFPEAIMAKYGLPPQVEFPEAQSERIPYSPEEIKSIDRTRSKKIDQLSRAYKLSRTEIKKIKNTKELDTDLIDLFIKMADGDATKAQKIAKQYGYKV